MKQSLHRVSVAAALLGAIACTDGGFTSVPMEPSLAKGGPPAPDPSADYTITDGALSLQSDGRGVYRGGVCGVGGYWDGVGGMFTPAAARISKAEQATCGTVPRAATVTLALRHMSDNPHVDQTMTPVSYSVGNVKWGTGGNNTTTINANNNGTPICGTIGLRFTTITYPGSNNTIRQDLGGGQWHLYTQPWPDNKGYCDNNGVITYWHVSFDMYAQVR